MDVTAGLNYTPRPELEAWHDFEEVTPDLMRRRISQPRDYYNKTAFFSARGVIDDMQRTGKTPKRSGQQLYVNRITSMLWDKRRVRTYGFILSSGLSYFYIPEEGIYHLHFQVTAYGTKNQREGIIVNPLISVIPPAQVGKEQQMLDLAQIQQYHMAANSYHTASCSVTELLAAGTLVFARVYLDRAAEGYWLAADGDADTCFYGFMVAPSKSSWRSWVAEPAPASKPWTDGELVTAQRMQDQSTKQFLALEDPARFTSRGFRFTLEGNKSAVLPWRVHLENSKKFNASDNSLTIPWNGLYLLALFGNVKRTPPPATGTGAAWHLGIHVDKFAAPYGGVIIARTGHPRVAEGRLNLECGISLSDVVFLQEGWRLEVQMFATYAGSKWVPSDTDPTPADRYWNLVVIYLGKGVKFRA